MHKCILVYWEKKQNGVSYLWKKTRQNAFVNRSEFFPVYPLYAPFYVHSMESRCRQKSLEYEIFTSFVETYAWVNC